VQRHLIITIVYMFTCTNNVVPLPVMDRIGKLT